MAERVKLAEIQGRLAALQGALTVAEQAQQSLCGTGDGSGSGGSTVGGLTGSVGTIETPDIGGGILGDD